MNEPIRKPTDKDGQPAVSGGGLHDDLFDIQMTPGHVTISVKDGNGGIKATVTGTRIINPAVNN
jgi:hypothetical protein